MPIATFYAVNGPKRIRMPILGVERIPRDWVELRQLLAEVMERNHVEHQTDECQVTLEKHLPGKFIRKFNRSYGSRRARYRRDMVGVFKLSYNPTSKRLTIHQAAFGIDLMAVTADFWWMERGTKWKTPRLIPKELENPKITMFEPSGARYTDYSRLPRLQYDLSRREETSPSSQPPHIRQYLPTSVRLRELVQTETGRPANG